MSLQIGFMVDNAASGVVVIDTWTPEPETLHDLRKEAELQDIGIDIGHCLFVTGDGEAIAKSLERRVPYKDVLDGSPDDIVFVKMETTQQSVDAGKPNTGEARQHIMGERSTGERSTEERGTEEQGTEEQGTEEQGTEEHGTEEQGTEEHGTEEHGTEERGTEERGTEERGTEERGTEERGTEERSTEERGTEERGTEERGTEEQGTEEHGTEEQGTDLEQGTEEQGTEEQGTDLEQGTEEQGTEEHGTEEQGTEEQGTEEQGTEEQGTGTSEAVERKVFPIFTGKRKWESKFHVYSPDDIANCSPKLSKYRQLWNRVAHDQSAQGMSKRDMQDVVNKKWSQESTLDSADMPTPLLDQLHGLKVALLPGTKLRVEIQLQRYKTEGSPVLDKVVEVIRKCVKKRVIKPSQIKCLIVQKLVE